MTTQKMEKPENLKDLMDALGVATSSPVPDTLKLLQIKDIASQKVNPFVDSLMQIVGTKADMLLKDQADGKAPVTYNGPQSSPNQQQMA